MFGYVELARGWRVGGDRTLQNDPLRPSPQESSKVLNHSGRSWHALLARALSANQFPLACANINNLLHRLPSIPDSSSIEEIVGFESLFFEGFSVWGLGSPNCDLAWVTKQSRSQKVVVGERRPSYCSVSNEFVPSWTGFESFHDGGVRGNYLFALVLGWSYILSARLVEMRRATEQDEISYTDDKALWTAAERVLSEDEGLSIPIGNADADECRWWAAILANGCGWQAILHRSGRKSYPPWSCHLNCGKRFIIRHDRLTGISWLASARPPSSAAAQQYLYNFAKLHDVYDQLLAALVSCLTIPAHGRFGAPVVLPEPTPMLKVNKRSTRSMFVDLIPSADRLPHLMALSCIPNTIASCMFGCLWEPGVHCNLASEWLNPILQERIPHLIQQRQLHCIVRIMAARRPNTAPLWLGSAMTGLLPRILDIVGTHVPSISVEAATWTRSSQSFMDAQFHRKPRIFKDAGGREFIQREDEFRLLYLTDTESRCYPSPPLCPWSPFGMVTLQNAAIEVQRHAFCGHRPTYRYWVWQGKGGRVLNDHGVRRPSMLVSVRSLGFQTVSLLSELRTKLIGCWQSPCTSRALEEISFDEKLSRSATRNIFTWTLGEGTRPEELELWKHEWLDGLLDDEEVDTDEGSMSSS